MLKLNNFYFAKYNLYFFKKKSIRSAPLLFLLNFFRIELCKNFLTTSRSIALNRNFLARQPLSSKFSNQKLYFKKKL